MQGFFFLMHSYCKCGSQNLITNSHVKKNEIPPFYFHCFCSSLYSYIQIYSKIHLLFYSSVFPLPVTLFLRGGPFLFLSLCWSPIKISPFIGPRLWLPFTLCSSLLITFKLYPAGDFGIAQDSQQLQDFTHLPSSFWKSFINFKK